MKLYKVLSVLFITFGIGLFMGTVMAEDKVFTNQDVEKYKKTSDSEPQSTKIDRTVDKSLEKRERVQKIKEENEKEYWCKKASQHRKKINQIKEDIAETDKSLSGEKLSHKKKKGLMKNLERNKKRLKYAEQDLSEFEDEAHRKSIPPGWLRCQFTD